METADVMKAVSPEAAVLGGKDGGMAMIGEKCPLCDGAVSQGRCTVCGMPYKKDEILYHLNENRRDHYKHATEKARALMRGKAPAPEGKAVGKNATREDIRAYQEKLRQEAVKRMTTTKAPVFSGKSSEKKKKRKQAEAARGAEKKKGKANLIFWIVLLLIIVLPSAVSFVRTEYDQYMYEKELEHYMEEQEDDTYAESGITDFDDPYFYEQADEDGRGYILMAGHGDGEVGTEIQPGLYTLVGLDEEAPVTLVIENSSETREFRVSFSTMISDVDLKEGDILKVEDFSEDYDGVYLYLQDDSSKEA